MSITIRSFEEKDAGAIRFAYKQAFAGAPWFENLTDEQVMERWLKCYRHFGFAALVAFEHENLVGSHWRELMNVAEVAATWGNGLGRFAFDFLRRQAPCPPELMTVHPGGDIIWERHLSVLPTAQGKGVGTMLRRAFIERLSREPGNFLVLTRMRADNAASIRTAEKIGFVRTGVVMSSRSTPGVNHEFWFRHVRGRL